MVLAMFWTSQCSRVTSTHEKKLEHFQKCHLQPEPDTSGNVPKQTFRSKRIKIKVTKKKRKNNRNTPASSVTFTKKAQKFWTPIKKYWKKTIGIIICIGSCLWFIEYLRDEIFNVVSVHPTERVINCTTQYFPEEKFFIYVKNNSSKPVYSVHVYTEKPTAWDVYIKPPTKDNEDIDLAGLILSPSISLGGPNRAEAIIYSIAPKENSEAAVIVKKPTECAGNIVLKFKTSYEKIPTTILSGNNHRFFDIDKLNNYENTTRSKLKKVDYDISNSELNIGIINNPKGSARSEVNIEEGHFIMHSNSELNIGGITNK